MKLTKDNWCRYLRWKGYDRDKEDPLYVINALVSGDVSFSCLKTAWPVGPDDKLACPENCAKHRSCYKIHPQVESAAKSWV